MITKEQEQFIIEHCQNKTYKEIGDIIGLSTSTINYYVKKNNIKKRKSLINNSEEIFIRDNYLTMTSTEIGKALGITGKQVRGWIKNHIKNPQSKIRQFDNRYFQKIDIPRKAYWLGFIYADGWISSPIKSNNPNCRAYEFGMELKSSDRYILEELNHDLGDKHIISNMHKEIRILNNKNESITDVSRLRVYSKDIVTDLYNNGIDYNKSHSKIFPIVSDSLFPAFLRGYIDGDGCIHKMKENHLAVHITSGTSNCLKYLQERLKKDFQIKSKIYSEEIQGYNTKYRLYIFRKEDVKKLLDLIYKDDNVPMLTRKYEIYTNFYGLTA